MDQGLAQPNTAHTVRNLLSHYIETDNDHSCWSSCPNGNSHSAAHPRIRTPCASDNFEFLLLHLFNLSFQYDSELHCQHDSELHCQQVAFTAVRFVKHTMPVVIILLQ